MMSTATVQRRSTGVIPAKAGTQCRASLVLNVGGAIPLVSRLRGNDGGVSGEFR
ncbi:MAG: hypothetical protein K0Q69_861 [Devosia sp.]|nr:hypothetical protein [Devosia sp.]